MESIGVLYLLRGIISGSIYALISLGFNVIYNTTGVINFAQGEFVMVGGIAAARAHAIHNLPLWASILCGAGCASLVGGLLHILAIYPARRASAVTHIIITIGASIVIQSFVSLVWGTDPFHLPVIMEGDIRIAGATLDLHSLIIVIIAVVLMGCLAVFYSGVSAGRAMRACSENADAARLCGISVNRMSSAAFALSALLGGIGGIMVTPLLSMSYHGGTMLGLKGFASAVIGGLGNPIGGVGGGLLLGVLEQYSAWVSSVYKDILALAIVVLVLLIRPKGLFSR